MSLDYAESLSKYPDKGVLGLREIFDPASSVSSAAATLAAWLTESAHTVFHTGAGISTSAGIPDFRGPQGVWTLEQKGLKPNANMDFSKAEPSLTHHAITTLHDQDYSLYVVSQNVDNLHLRSGLPKSHLSELHGNRFSERCTACGREHLRESPTSSIGLRKTGGLCTTVKPGGRSCRGKMVDTVLDWEDSLPWDELDESEYQSKVATLAVCMGTTLQIQPAGNLPLRTKHAGGRVVMINLQKTRMDKHADLVIHAKVDEVMKQVFQHMKLSIVSKPAFVPPPAGTICIKEGFRVVRPALPSYRVKRCKVDSQGQVTKTEGSQGGVTKTEGSQGGVTKTEDIHSSKLNSDGTRQSNGQNGSSSSVKKETVESEPDSVKTETVKSENNLLNPEALKLRGVF